MCVMELSNDKGFSYGVNVCDDQFETNCDGNGHDEYIPSQKLGVSTLNIFDS